MKMMKQRWGGSVGTMGMAGMLMSVLILGGCGAMQTAAVQPVEVKVPVSVPCKVAAPKRPDFAVDALHVGAGVWEQMKALRAERLQRMGYEQELEAAVGACQ